MHQNASDDLPKQEKFLLYSMDSLMDLYLIMLSALVEIRKKEIEFLDKSSKKHLATAVERNPNRRFVDNAVLATLSDNAALQEALTQRKIDNWTRNDDYILLLLEDVKKSALYQQYMAAPSTDFQKDKHFIADLFTEVIAPNDKLYDYLEDHRLTWIDDIPVINTQIAKQLRALSSPGDRFEIVPLYKDIEDRDFARELLRKTVLNEPEFARQYTDKTPNWDTDRIAEIDTIILKMAICEFLKFPSIPVKVTINEYLEIAKEYSTPKSSIFINGILDNLVKEYQAGNKLNKSGRGLL
jgi:N utilization substance protein B